MSITTALEARRDAALRDREAGFTLIELLVVVIIIGILAAIAIPIYIGVQNNAKDSSVKSDLTNAKTAVVSGATDNNGFYPTAVSSDGAATINGVAVDLKPNGWSRSANTTSLVYVPGPASASTGGNGPTTWCILGTSSINTKFVITSTTAVAKAQDQSATTCSPS